MLLLGWVVGKGATPVDEWFQQYWDSPAARLALVTSPLILVVLLVVVLLVALYRRRWQLAAATALAPLLGIAFVRMLKPVFGREKDGALAYPSGHVTTLVIVWGLVVLAAGCAWWAVLVAIAVILVGMLGVGITFHYFTDTVGGLLLGSAIVCVAALTSGQIPHRT
ncbi:phosphoesterase PA-phosphatase [Mycolicibacterium sp. P9-64]|nr:phosphoesterase PA-phosphatase [Mycolicibacterium sp. P9-64]